MADPRANLDIAELVVQHHRAVYRYAYRLTGAACDADDLTQQVFLAAQQKLGQLREQSAARGWLFAILRNLFLKSRRRRMLSPDDLGAGLESIPAKIPHDDGIDREELQRALDGLSPEARLAVAMYYFEECSYREIAAQMEWPIGTVMSRLARAKAQLRNRLLDGDAWAGIERSRQKV